MIILMYTVYYTETNLELNADGNADKRGEWH